MPDRTLQDLSRAAFSMTTAGGDQEIYSALPIPGSDAATNVTVFEAQAGRLIIVSWMEGATYPEDEAIAVEAAPSALARVGDASAACALEGETTGPPRGWQPLAAMTAQAWVFPLARAEFLSRFL